MGGSFSWNGATVTVLFAGTVCLFLVVRLYPIWAVRFQGCDAYYILMCAESFRREPRLPIRLPPVYLLEDQTQWYPPGFLILCALIPSRWLERYFWVLNHLIDLLTILIGFAICAALGNPLMGLVGILMYALASGLILEYASLTTRPFGAFLLTAFLVCAHYGTEQWLYELAAALFGIALIYSHKLSAQQLWFTLPILAVLSADWRWLAWLPALYLLAFLIWPRGFVGLARAHVGIIRFWNRYWPLLGAHSVRQSPVYGDRTTHTEFYGVDSWSSAVSFLKETLHQNYFIIPAIVFASLTNSRSALDLFLLDWILSVYVAAFAIRFVRSLRGIGLGRQYVKFGVLPTITYLAIHGLQLGAVSIVISAAAAALTVRQYLLVVANYSREESSQVGRSSPELLSLIDVLKADSARVICLPVHLCDLVAYMGSVPTYWGAHSDRFNEKLAEFFPVLRRRIEEYAADDQLTHFLLDTRYAKPEEIPLPGAVLVKRAGSYVLFKLRGGLAE
jgi:hypothetical protein